MLLIAWMMVAMEERYLLIVIAQSWLTIAPLRTTHPNSVVEQLPCSEEHLMASKMILLPIKQGALVAVYLHTLTAALTPMQVHLPTMKWALVEGSCMQTISAVLP